MHLVVPFLLSWILRDVSFAEVGSVCRVALQEPMHLCTCVSEEGCDGEAPCPETPSLLSYTLRYISFTEVGSVGRVALREPMHLCTYTLKIRQFRRGAQRLPGCVARTDAPVYMRERGGGRRGSSVPRNATSAVIHTQIHQFRRGSQRLPGCVARTDAPVYTRERGGGRRRSSVPRSAISAVIHT